METYSVTIAVLSYGIVFLLGRELGASSSLKKTEKILKAFQYNIPAIIKALDQRETETKDH